MQRTVLDPSDRFRVQSKLDRNETLVWVGRPVPTSRYRDWIGIVLFGALWFALVFAVGGTTIHGLWFSDGTGEITVNGTKTTYGALSVWARIGLTAFFVPFFAIGVGTVGSPLWYRLWQSGLIHAVTDSRALRIGRVACKSWRACEILPRIDRADRRDGLTDLFFTTRTVSNGKSGGSRQVPDGFVNLPSHVADEAELALRALKGTPGA